MVTSLWPLCDLLLTSQWDEKSFIKSLLASGLDHTHPHTRVQSGQLLLILPGGSFQWSGLLWSKPVSSVCFLCSSLEWPPSDCDTWPVSSWLPAAFDPTLMSHLTTPLPQGREWRWTGVPFHRWKQRNQGRVTDGSKSGNVLVLFFCFFVILADILVFNGHFVHLLGLLTFLSCDNLITFFIYLEADSVKQPKKQSWCKCWCSEQSDTPKQTWAGTKELILSSLKKLWFSVVTLFLFN